MPNHFTLNEREVPFAQLTPIARALQAGLLGLFVTGIACAAESAETQKEPPEGTLPVVTVKASADQETATGPVQGYVAKRSSTATKTDTSSLETPQSISIITADQIKDQGAGTLTEALRYSAGVRAEAIALNNRDDSFRLRGGSEGSTLLIGLRSSQSHPFKPYLTNEPFGLERIEVLRGPASVIAGQNGHGGVVNLVSKRPQADASRSVELQGPQRPALEAIRETLGLSNSVSLPGLDPTPWDRSSSVGLFVLCSHFEGFPNALCEAMAHGIPVIATDCPSGPREIIEHGKNGLLVPPADVQALADAMASLLSDPARRTHMGHCATDITQRFGLEKVMRMWEDVLPRTRD